MNPAWGPPLLLAAALIWWICTGLYILFDKPVWAVINAGIALAFSYLARAAFRR